MPSIKRKPGRPEHVPTDAGRAEAKALAGYGVPQEKIAAKLGIGKHTLRKYYGDELEKGEIEVDAMIRQTMVLAACNPQNPNPTLLIFLAKTRLGMKETTVHEHVGDIGIHEQSTEDLERELNAIRTRKGIADRAGVRAPPVPDKPGGVLH
jgi:hypothetical protein